jgi:hypothetical protein
MKQLAIMILLLNSYACREKDRTLHIFIPENYVGEIGLYFGIDSSKNHMISSKDDMYVLFLSGKNLKKHTIKEKNYPGGPYAINYYYYSKDTLYQLNSTTVLSNIIVDTTKWVYDPGSSGENGSIKHFSIEKVK